MISRTCSEIASQKKTFQNFPIYLRPVQQMRLSYLKNLNRLVEIFHLIVLLWIQEKTNDTDAEQSDSAAAYHPVRLVASAKPEPPKSEEVEPPTEKKSRRHKYGVDDEQLSLGDARSKFGEPM